MGNYATLTAPAGCSEYTGCRHSAGNLDALDAGPVCLVRHFIDERMQAACGEQWIKHRMPGDMRQRWQEKKEHALKNGEPDRPLIAYADFTDYLTIIARSDNWREVFSAIFGRGDSVRESFQRLYPIRLCVMHARVITQDDELYLHVETMRLLKAIKV